MKTQVLIILLLLANILLSAQEYQYVPFPDSNAVWSEVYWKPIDEASPSWAYNKYALFNEDTIINGIAYHKLFHTNASEITRENSTCIGGIREDSLKRVFYYCTEWLYRYNESIHEQNEIMYYDFSVSLGDTVWNIPSLLEFEYLVVKQIDTLQLYNTLRKVFSFQLSNCEGILIWTKWIEGIGNIKGLIFYEGDLPTNGMDNDLVCMHQNDTLLYYYSGSGGIYDACVPQFVLDGVSILPNTEINVYPNPATGGLVYFEGLNFETLELFNINGSLIKEESIKNINYYELDVADLPAGIYTYRLKSKGLIPTQGKLIIQ